MLYDEYELHAASRGVVTGGDAAEIGRLRCVSTEGHTLGISSTCIFSAVQLIAAQSILDSPYS